jgi:hypothetical protein
MSTPPPHPGQPATSGQQPAESIPAEGPGGDRAGPQPAKYGTHQVLWGIGGLILGLLVGVLGTQAVHSTGPAASGQAAAPGARSARPTAAARAGHRTAVAGTTINGTGVFIVGQDIESGAWHTAGAVGGSAGTCHVALLRRAGSSSVIDSHVGTGPYTIVTRRHASAFQTSGCRTWHYLGRSHPGSHPARSGPPRTRSAQLRA